MNDQSSNVKYEKLLIDNAVCRRRFHLVYEEGIKRENHVEIKCPHCGVILFEENNHPSITLARDENLIKSPDGTETIVYECKFLK